MAKSVIVNVSVNNGKYEVLYSSNTTRFYPMDNAPGTVARWLEANAPKVETNKEEHQEEPKETAREFQAPVVVTMETGLVPVMEPMPAPGFAAIFAGYLTALLMWLDVFGDFVFDFNTGLLILWDKVARRFTWYVAPVAKEVLAAVMRYVVAIGAVLVLLMAKGIVKLAQLAE